MGKTIAQKIFDAHLVDDSFETTLIISLDRVFAHEITTPPAILDMEQRGLNAVFNPSKIKAVIDHVSPSKDTLSAIQAQIMRNWAHKNHIVDFFDIGRNGVCHALFPEKGFVYGPYKGNCSS